MRYSKRASAIAAISLAAAACPALAAAWDSQSFDTPSKVAFHDFIANVDIVVAETDQVTISISNEGKEPVLIRQNGDTLELYSRNKPDSRKFWKQINWSRDGDKAFDRFMADYPDILVTVPAGMAIEMDNLAAKLTAGDLNAPLDIKSTIYMTGTIGDLSEADIRITGGGNLLIGDVEGDLKSSISGAGDLEFASAGNTKLNIRGSGDMVIGTVRGNSDTSIHGSGNVELGDVAGGISLDIAGSGDVSMGRVTGETEVSIRGSGDVEMDEFDGPLDISIMGNGDIEIGAGRAEALSVSINGSGDFDFQGLAVNPSVAIRGSGDVFIKDYEGDVKTSGDGDIRIGNITID